ncbi:MAG: metallophosphoesterase [Clostridia bacterium]|nr:metallophosphoesterase [Clostridia bacterium]
MRQITRYTVADRKIPDKITFAVVSDLHDRAWDDVLSDILGCDAVLVPGDLVDRHRKTYENALRFLREMPEKLPVFYSTGNHERRHRRADEFRQLAEETDARILDNEMCLFRGIMLGGYSSAAEGEEDTSFLDRFEQAEAYKLLLCHHPEMYRRDVAGRNVNLTVCGHAHGGQIRIGGHSLYAPGQGLFPEMTYGFYDHERMLLSRGMTNGTFLPRINVPCELIILTLEHREENENER